MKLTFSCHYHQLGQKNPTQCYQTEINQLNLGIYLKKKMNWINVPSKAEINQDSHVWSNTELYFLQA